MCCMIVVLTACSRYHTVPLDHLADELESMRRQLARSQADNSRLSTSSHDVEARCASKVRAAEMELTSAQASLSMLREVRGHCAKRGKCTCLPATPRWSVCRGQCYEASELTQHVTTFRRHIVRSIVQLYLSCQPCTSQATCHQSLSLPLSCPSPHDLSPGAGERDLSPHQGQGAL